MNCTRKNIECAWRSNKKPVRNIMAIRKVGRPNFEKRGGLVTVVAQDAKTLKVLMVAYTNEACYLETLRNGYAVYYSTSRNERWMKGEKSGDTQIVDAILLDCDADAIIYLVRQRGEGACHTKAASCFFRMALENSQLMPAPDTDEEDAIPLIETEVNDAFIASMERFLASETAGKK